MLVIFHKSVPLNVSSHCLKCIITVENLNPILHQFDDNTRLYVQRPKLHSMKQDTDLRVSSNLYVNFDQFLRHHHGACGHERHRGGDGDGGVLDGLQEQLENGDVGHRPRRESQARGKEVDGAVDEDEGGDGHERLGKTRDDRPESRSKLAHVLRSEYECDGQTLGDVVHGQRQRDELAEVVSVLAAEGDSDADAFGEGV